MDQILNEEENKDIKASEENFLEDIKAEKSIKAFKEFKDKFNKGVVEEKRIEKVLKEEEKSRKRQEEESLKLIMKLQQEEEQAEREKAKKMEEESMRLIKEMELEEEKELKVRVKNKEKEDATNCEICLEDIDIKDLLPLDHCEHLYHSKCLSRYLVIEIDARKFPLCCPMCKDEVSALDIKEILSKDALKKWEEYTFKKMVESNPKEFSFCPTPNCPYVFIWEEEEKDTHFHCPGCKKDYCLHCRCEYHTNQSCAEYRAAVMLVIKGVE